MKWVLAFLNEEGEVSEEGTRPLIEQIRLKEAVAKVDISRDGILGAASSRKLDKAGYRLHEERGLVPFRAAAVHDVNRFLSALWGDTVLALGRGPKDALLNRLTQHKATKVVVLEVYAGHAGLTATAHAVGHKAAPPIDARYASYGRSWDMRRAEDRALVDLLIEQLDPLVVHLGLPCEPYSRIGVNQPTPEDEAMLKHAVSTLKRRNDQGRIWSRP